MHCTCIWPLSLAGDLKLPGVEGQADGCIHVYMYTCVGLPMLLALWSMEVGLWQLPAF